MKPLALVTGGSRGVGRAIVERMAADFRVVFTYRQDSDAAAEVDAAVSAAGGEAFPVQADLADPETAAGVVTAVVAEHGDVSMVVGNAGVASRGRTAADTDDSEYLRLFRVHTLSNVALVRAALPSLRRDGGGAVFVSSVLTDLKPSHTAPYTAAKAALEAIAVIMAREERSHGVRINVIAPSLVATDMGDRLAKATLGETMPPSWIVAPPWVGYVGPEMSPTRSLSWPVPAPPTSPDIDWSSMAADPHSRCTARTSLRDAAVRSTVERPLMPDLSEIFAERKQYE
ncbi:MAG TPA: SDR family oxidoreductase [Mycobacterium sp.]